jgi:hypothetical protein
MSRTARFGRGVGGAGADAAAGDDQALLDAGQVGLRVLGGLRDADFVDLDGAAQPDPVQQPGAHRVAGGLGAVVAGPGDLHGRARRVEQFAQRHVERGGQRPQGAQGGVALALLDAVQGGLADASRGGQVGQRDPGRRPQLPDVPADDSRPAVLRVIAWLIHMYQFSVMEVSA